MLSGKDAINTQIEDLKRFFLRYTSPIIFLLSKTDSFSTDASARGYQ